MYKLNWDKETRGIILSDKLKDFEVISPPRPVFFEELDLLGFHRYWSYPKVKEPILWRIGRNYYYKGNIIAEIKGGNLFEEPSIFIIHKNINLEPVNLNLMLEKNNKKIFVLENEAIDFIEYIYKKYKNKINCFAVAYSGGKDSQVVLDIVSRVIAPDEYFVIFSDTTIENSFTYEMVEKTKKRYKEIYPDFRFYSVRPNEEAFYYWQKFGPSSRIQRWCCSVYKTAPFVKFLREISKNSNGPDILVFEGVRAKESARRSRYEREAKSVKHISLINSRVIFNWNDSEVYTYLFNRRLEFNNSYRNGLDRVGCSVCPFNSEWSEFLIKKLFRDKFDKFYEILKTSLRDIGISNEENLKKYISRGQWKKRSSCIRLENDETRLDIIEDNNDLKAILTNPRESILEWVKPIGSISYKKDSNSIKGKLNSKNNIYDFEINYNNNHKVNVFFKGVCNNISLKSDIKNVLNKTTYCINCGGCEPECKTMALQVYPKVAINSRLCTKCRSCITFDTKGCLFAKSLRTIGGGNSMNKKTSSIDKYSTFGIRKEWLDDYLNNSDIWFEKNNLGNKQVDAMVSWLRDGSLLYPKQKVPTDLVKILNKLKIKNYIILWQILWVNLSHYSTIINWYVNKVKFGNYSKQELKELIKNDFPNLSEGTLSNPIDAMVNMFDKSPIGKELKLGILEKKGNTVIEIKKIGSDEINPIVVAYSLYKYAEENNKYNFTVSEIFNDNCKWGPFKIFGINKKQFENILRYLQEIKNQFVKVDLIGGLDNINLNKDLKSIEILEITAV